MLSLTSVCTIPDASSEWPADASVSKLIGRRMFEFKKARLADMAVKQSGKGSII
jgi:hypothetical protein